jgi:antitoxin HicB
MNKSIGSSFDDFLIEEGIYEEVEAGAIKKIIAYQLQEVIEKEQLSRTVTV